VLIAIGLVGGVAGAYGLSRTLAAFLFGVGVTEPQRMTSASISATLIPVLQLTALLGHAFTSPPASRRDRSWLRRARGLCWCHSGPTSCPESRGRCGPSRALRRATQF
jgi:hypothetical protein